jgi:hypothetical protein
VDFINCHMAILGEDGETAMGKIQQKARGPGCLPADIVKMIEDYCKDLSNRVVLRELSVDLEKERESERLTRLKAIETEVGKLKEAGKRGEMAGLMRGSDTLTSQLREYLKGIEADEEDGVSSDTTGKWKKAAEDLTDNILEELKGMGRDVGSEEEDALGPLRRAMGRIASLNEAVNLAKAAPEEGQLRDLGRKLGMAKKELMVLGRDLVMNQVPTLAAETHDLAGKAEDAIRAGQMVVKAALRGLGVAYDISEAGSLDLPPPPQRPAMGGLIIQFALQPARPVGGPFKGRAVRWPILFDAWQGPKPMIAGDRYSMESTWSILSSGRSCGPTGRLTTDT